MQTIGFFICPGFQILDLAGPLAAFQTACHLAISAPYRLQVLSAAGGLVGSTAGADVATAAATTVPALDTLVVTGGIRTHDFASHEIEAVRTLAERACRVSSVCTGAFLLAEAGLLDGRRVTTHWRYAARLQRTFPRIQVDGDRIFIRDGTVWTSAGITAGIDLALALIERDHGAELARSVASELVVHHRRRGGQSQFSEMLALDAENDRIRRALSFAQSHLADRLDVERLAEIACLGPRQFSRAFRAQTGETPAKAVERLRVEAARARIESNSEPVEQIAALVGFRDPERMRRAFLRRFGHPPQALRRAARVHQDR